MKGKPDLRPTTVDATARVVVSLVPEDEQSRIAAMPEADLDSLHFGQGQWIRNYFGLWQGNAALLDATGQPDPDGASGVIIRAYWQRLWDDQPKMH